MNTVEKINIILKEANICEFEKETFNVRPKDFEKINGFNLIYTGKYALYSGIVGTFGYNNISFAMLRRCFCGF